VGRSPRFAKDPNKNAEPPSNALQRIERRKAGTRRRAKLLKFAQRKAERQEARRKKMEKERGETGLEDGDGDDVDADDYAGGDVKRGEEERIKGEGDDDDDDDDDDDEWAEGEGEKRDVSGSDDDGESMFSSSLGETGSAGGSSKKKGKEMSMKGGPSSRAEPYQMPADKFTSVEWWRHPQHEKLRMMRLGITSKEFLPREDPETVVQAYRYGHR